MGFNANNYERVKQRKTRLLQDYPNAIMMPIMLSDTTHSGNYVLVGALVWKDKKERDALTPEAYQAISDLGSKATPQNAGVIMAAMALATKADASGHSMSIAGGKGADGSAWVENAEESAVGRALDNLGYHSNSASREEMEKIQHISETRSERQKIEAEVNQMLITLQNRGVSLPYINQQFAQQLRQFNNLQELTMDEVYQVKTIMENIANNMNKQTS